MKRILVIFGLMCWILLLQTDTYAQRNQTKCPPKQKGWKSKERKELVKFPELLKKDRQQERAERKMVYATRQKEDKKTAQIERSNYYTKERFTRAKTQKPSNKTVASTKCPR